MPAFLAYFDLLGYKKFIENNTPECLNSRTNHFGRNIEAALSLDRPPLTSTRTGRLINDISQSTLNCLTFSDTVVLWSNGVTMQDFEEILRVSFKYNHFNVCLDFPSRGCIAYGDIWFKPFDQENMRGGKYMFNMIYGKVLVTAYEKAEKMSWAGCVLDESAIRHAKTLGNIDALLEEHTKLYDVPYKTGDGEIRQSEYALKLNKGDLVRTEDIADGIRRAFTQDNKGEIEGRIKVIFDNTIEFLEAHKMKFPHYYRIDITKDALSHQIFGKLDEDYNHTIVTRRQENNQSEVYEIEVVSFEPSSSNRDFLNAEQIQSEVFEAQLQNARDRQ